MREFIILIIGIICLIIIICSTVDVWKKTKELDKMHEKIKETYYKYLKSLALLLSPEEALELINEVVDLPNGYYLGIDSNDILTVTLFKNDENMPNQMGKTIEEFTLNSYKSNEIISFGIELLNYISKREQK